MKISALISLCKKHLNKNMELEQENIKLRRENENLRRVLKLYLNSLENNGVAISYWADDTKVEINTLIKDESK